ncbi:MAG: ABC transporter substrate-binding protein [Treponema sp.]|jgi:peptide/nickel transport system substrate-binding protein|nr:ABC transporter substrate-binding protein [Treponema sp.]
MKVTKRVAAMALTLLVAAGSVFGAGEQGASTGTTGGGASAAAPGTLPRRETLYFNGILWDQVNHWSPYSVSDRTFGITAFNQLSRQLIFETLFVYNLLDGKLYPQLGETYTWNGQTLTVTLNRNVKFWNGNAMTAKDVVNSYELQKTYATGGTAYWSYIDSVTARDDYTVVIQAKASNFNPKQIEASISALYITEKAAMDQVVARIGNSPTALGQWTNIGGGQTIEAAGTGPYRPYIWDETKAVVQRVDTYWGQIASKYGKLPTPKYVAHSIYKDNATGDAAFRAGEVDISQQFISSVWTMFPQNISTYLPQAPYYFPGTIPMLVYNTKKPGLDDPAVRRAIAMSLDYNTIGTNAMSGYTAPLVASLMLPVPSEQALIDTDALKQYQWSGNVTEATAAANKLLDDAGWVKGADGIRAKNGVRLSFQTECPQGWSDWNATLEVVAQAGKNIGIDIKTYFPISTVWTQDYQNGTFDMIMYSYGSVGIASPWNRAYQAMGSTELPPEGTPNTIQNWGRWINAEANDIVAKIASETNAATLKQLWTRLNIIYLQEMPCSGLMYRPGVFHTVNESVWTGYPKMNDGSNVPPTLCIDGYGIKGLYNLRAK